jgi:hypothetical protein
MTCSFFYLCIVQMEFAWRHGLGGNYTCIYRVRVARTRRTTSEAGFFITRYIMTDVATASPYLYLISKAECKKGQDGPEDVPGEDVLGVIIAQVDLGWSAKGNTARLVLHHSDVFRL